MGKPKGNGLIEMVDDKSSDKEFFCMQLVSFICDEQNENKCDVWDIRFAQAKNRTCFYRNKCRIYARTIAKLQNKPVQLNIFD